MANITDSEEGRAMLERVEQQFAEAQKRKPQHIISRYPRLPKFECKLVLPKMPEEKVCD